MGCASSKAAAAMPPPSQPAPASAPITPGAEPAAPVLAATAQAGIVAETSPAISDELALADAEDEQRNEHPVESGAEEEASRLLEHENTAADTTASMEAASPMLIDNADSGPEVGSATQQCASPGEVDVDHDEAKRAGEESLIDDSGDDQPDDAPGELTEATALAPPAASAELVLHAGEVEEHKEEEEDEESEAAAVANEAGGENVKTPQSPASSPTTQPSCCATCVDHKRSGSLNNLEADVGDSSACDCPAAADPSQPATLAMSADTAEFQPATILEELAIEQVREQERGGSGDPQSESLSIKDRAAMFASGSLYKQYSGKGPHDSPGAVGAESVRELANRYGSAATSLAAEAPREGPTAQEEIALVTRNRKSSVSMKKYWTTKAEIEAMVQTRKDF